MINLLTYGLLTRSSQQDSAYSFYVYLYFADRNEPNLNAAAYVKQYHAAAAIRDLFGDVVSRSTVRGLPCAKDGDTTRCSLAALYVPVDTNKEHQLVEAVSSPDTLLRIYDYDRAVGLAQIVEQVTGRRPPRMALIASEQPLHLMDTEDSTRASDLTQLYLVTLEVGGTAIKRRILGFRDALLSAIEDVDDVHANAVSREYLEQFSENRP